MLRSSTLVICRPYANDRYDTRDARESWLEVRYSCLGQVRWLYAGHKQTIDTILVTHARVRLEVCYSCFGQVRWLYAGHTQTIDTILVTHARVRLGYVTHA